jgi:pyroglutamyl-peptidase
VFYTLMHALQKQRGKGAVRGGFIHVPLLPDQGAPSMPLGEIVHGLRVAVECALNTTEDRAMGAGSLN